MEEIVFACYECSDTFCKLCIQSHDQHTVIFFKDSYLVSNYDQVTQVQAQAATQPPASSSEKDGDPAESDEPLCSRATVKHLNARVSDQLKLQPKAPGKLLPPIEAFTAQDKFTRALVFVKKFKDFKGSSQDFKECVMAQIERTRSLQDDSEDCSVRIIKYMIANNSLYVITEQCNIGLRDLLQAQRSSS